MEKRIRSPNYPSLSLPEAVQRVAQVYRNQHTHGAPREVVAKSMGYNSLNGASATAISALIKYGLLEGRADEIRVSDRAMRILHPESREEKVEAVREAAKEPSLFRELAEKFPGTMPAEPVLRNHLVRSGFAPSAISSVILAYRETNEFVEDEVGAYDSVSPPATVEVPAMHFSTQPESGPNPTASLNSNLVQGVERYLGQYHFEGGGSLRIVVDGEVDTEKALSMAETLINMKRVELQSRDVPMPVADQPLPENDDESDADT